jgi:hypothetical protein
MKRLIALAMLVGAVLALPATMSGAGTGDNRGPACADIVGGGAIYSGGTLTLDAELAGTPCAFGSGRVTYTLDVYDDANSATPTVSSSNWVPTADPATIEYVLAVADDDGTVCVALSSNIAKHEIDLAPDADVGCINVSSTPPGFGGFN